MFLKFMKKFENDQQNTYFLIFYSEYYIQNSNCVNNFNYTLDKTG